MMVDDTKIQVEVLRRIEKEGLNKERQEREHKLEKKRLEKKRLVEEYWKIIWLSIRL